MPTDSPVTANDRLVDAQAVLADARKRLNDEKQRRDRFREIIRKCNDEIKRLRIEHQEAIKSVVNCNDDYQLPTAPDYSIHTDRRDAAETAVSLITAEIEKLQKTVSTAAETVKQFQYAVNLEAAAAATAELRLIAPPLLNVALTARRQTVGHALRDYEKLLNEVFIVNQHDLFIEA